jgi:CBS domain-containing protein
LLHLTAAEFHDLFEEDTVFRDFCTNHLSMLLNQAERVRQGEYVQLVTAQQSLSAPLATLLKREPIACLPSTALETALEKMARLNIGAIVIVNEAQEPVGIFTERDVLRRVVLARADLHTLPTPHSPFPIPHASCGARPC